MKIMKKSFSFVCCLVACISCFSPSALGMGLPKFVGSTPGFRAASLNGLYVILPKSNSKVCLTLSDPRNGGNSVCCGRVRELWRIVPMLQQGVHKLESTKLHLFLEASATDPTVGICSASPSESQCWYFERVERDGPYSFRLFQRSRSRSECVYLTYNTLNGQVYTSPVVDSFLKHLGSSVGQLWEVMPATWVATPIRCAECVCFTLSVNPAVYLAIPDPRDGAKVCGGSKDDALLTSYLKEDSSYVFMIGTSSNAEIFGLNLAISRGYKDVCCRVGDNSDCQRWFLIPFNADGCYAIHSKGTDLCLTYSPLDGTVYADKWCGSDNQIWQLHK